MTSDSDTTHHQNEERTVECPVEGCDATPLARGVHLHIMRSDGNGHGDGGEVPNHINLDNLKTAGEQTVDMDYPDTRETEAVKRLCPYCERPFRGSHGVMIHLGQVEGRKNHPEDAADRHEEEDFPIVEVDKNDNVIEVVEGRELMPSTERRRESGSDLDPDAAKGYVKSLRAEGKHEEAARAARMLDVDLD